MKYLVQVIIVAEFQLQNSKYLRLAVWSPGVYKVSAWLGWGEGANNLSLFTAGPGPRVLWLVSRKF